MRLMLVALALLIGACEERVYHFRKPGASIQEFEQVKVHCWNQGLAIAPGNPYTSVAAVAHNCMIANGWERVD